MISIAIVSFQLLLAEEINIVIFIIAPDIHRLIHATKSETIQQILAKLELSKKQIAKVNKFRVQVENIVI